MRTHVEQGERIVGGIGWLEDASAVVSGHHEKWEGSGYPRGEQIPLSARIFSAADVFDAELELMQQDTGRHFDPGVMNVFLGLACNLHGCLVGCEEYACRTLLEERGRLHFGWS